jgi:DNA-directed RNA polymerase specialized sigma24 family protein
MIDTPPHSWVTTDWYNIEVGRGEGATALQARRVLLLRYHEVVLRYFRAKLRDENVAWELYSNFTVRLLETDALIKRADPERGPFRHYLKRALHNMVRDHFRRGPGLAPLPPDAIDDPPVDEDFDREWRQELLNRAWKELAESDRRDGQSEHYPVLRFLADHPGLKPSELAAQLGAKLGKPMSIAATRQARYRARCRFGELLLAEVDHSLGGPTLDELAEELASLGLLRYCRHALEECRKA